MLISVVVPVYNVEKYLKRCLDSLVNQTYKTLQVILVDDGSTDASSDICDQYTKKYSIFQTIHKKNGGLSSARNAGIPLCNGEYITFLDADDWFERRYIEVCVKKLMESSTTNVELLLTSYVKEYDNKSLLNPLFKKNNCQFPSEKLVRSKILRRIFGPVGQELKEPQKVDNLSTAWGKFYLTKICKKVKFVDTKIIGTEDAWFNINYIYQINNAIYTSDVSYHYYKGNSGSLVSTYNTELLDRWTVLYSKMREFIVNNSLGSEYKIALNNRIVCNLIALTNNVFISNYSFFQKYKEEERILKNALYKNAFFKFDFSNLKFKWWLFFKLCQKKYAMLLCFAVEIEEHLR